MNPFEIEKNIKEIKELIIQNKIEKAVEQLLILTEKLGENSLHNGIILISKRKKELDEEIGKNLLYQDQIEVRSNKITNALLNYCDKITRHDANKRKVEALKLRFINFILKNKSKTDQTNSKMNETKINEAKTYAFNAHLKDIYLEIPEYTYNHSSVSGENDEIFIGRDKIKEKFLNILKSGKQNGAYLVTGYRGMGKTSFVKNVITEYKNKNGRKEKTTISQIDISFAQAELKEIDILKQLTKALIDEAEKNWWIIIRKQFTLLNIFRFIAFALSTIAVYFIAKYIYSVYSNYSSLKLNISFTKYTIDKIKPILNSGSNIFAFTISFLTLLVMTTLSLTYFLSIIKSLLDGFLNLLYRIKNKSARYLIYLVTFIFISLLIYGIKIQTPLLVLLAFIGYCVVFLILFILFEKPYSHYIFSISFLFEYILKETSIYNKLVLIYERCNSTITNESGYQSAGTNVPFGFIQRNVKSYPIASPKEVEYELIDILKKYSKFTKYKKKIIIVFDELDKVEPAFGKGYYYDDTKSLSQYDYSQNQLNDIRDRKRVVINILASFKYFITEANARFIFIAGREMFDAALADIADRQSSISSIFHHIIYVDSFLKDTDSNNQKSSGLTDLVESYLYKVLIKSELRFNENSTFNGLIKTYFEYLEKVQKIDEYEKQSSDYKEHPPLLLKLSKIALDEKMKIIFTLQNFIIYLTYRSNGSPKKLVRLIEDYIVSDKQLPKDAHLSIITYDKEINIDKKNRHRKIERKFLQFDSNAQYKFGFITYLYRPFLISYSQTIKKYSDNVLVSTPYLMDHLIKFHPYAFSLQNLELLPEVLSANRNPILRFFIEELIYFLSQNHIRETDIGLFEYKFFNKTSNEIIYLSKIFEEESAAFNFTLDESYFIKLYLRNKVKELRSSYKDFKKSGEYIYSISFINGILGDAHYFDQEFDDAIVSYQDALQHLRIEKNLTYEQFVLWMKYKLKLGLIHEKMKSYDIALAYYNDAIIESRKYIKNYGKKTISQNVEIHEKVDINVKFNQKESETDKDDKFVTLDEGLQIVNQAYIASLYLYEKINIGGINESRIHRYQKDFLTVLAKVEKEEDVYNNLVASNYYNNVGTLLYYKNMILERDKENGCEPKSSKIKQLMCENFEKFAIDFTDTDKGKYEIKKPTLIQEPQNKDYRFSFFAFWHYKKALESVLSADKTKGEYSSLIALSKECSNYLSNFENKFDKTRLRMIGFTLSKIGDILLSALNTEKGRLPANNILCKASEVWANKALIDDKIDKLKGAKEDKEKQNLLNEICEGWMDSSIKSSKEGKYYIGDTSKSDDELTVVNAYEKLEKYKGEYRILSFIDKIMITYFNDLDKKYIDSPDIDFILYLYLMAGRYYSKAGKSISFSFQLRKVIHVIRNTVLIKPNTESNIEIFGEQYFKQQTNLITFLEKVILAQVLEITSWNTNSSDRPQIYKYKDSVGVETIYHPINRTKYIYSHISNSPEVKEAVLFLADIKVKSTDFSKFDNLCDLEKCPEQGLINPSFNIAAQFTRIQELGLQEKINRGLLEEYIFPKLFGKDKFYRLWEKQHFKIFKKYDSASIRMENDEITSVDQRETISKEQILTVKGFIDKITKEEKVEKINEYIALVANSISSLTQIISIIKVYDVNYYMSYSFLATFQMKLGTWLKHYSLCKELARQMNKESNVITDIDKDFLQPMMGTQAMITLDTTSQYQIALQYFHKAKQVHSNGATYQTQVRNMLYLEDDFNDSLYHFGIALERQQINSYKVRAKIKRLEEELEDSPLYDYGSFVNNQEIKD